MRLNRLEKIGAANLGIVITCFLAANFAGGDLSEDTNKLNSGYFEYSFIYGTMTALCGLLTFFGFLSDPSSRSEGGAIQESQVRLSIAASLFVVFLIYFSTVSYWSDEEKVSEFFKLIFPEFAKYLAIVLAFYFGAKAAMEIFKKRDT